MQSNLCVHTKYENMDKIYLYPIWEFFLLYTVCSVIKEAQGKLNAIQHLFELKILQILPRKYQWYNTVPE